MLGRNHRRSWLLALAASVAVHVAIFAWLTSAQPDAPQALPSVPVQVEIVQLEAAPPKNAAESPPAVDRKTASAPKSAPRKRQARGPESEAQPAEVARAAPAEALASDVPRAGPDEPLAASERGDFLVPKAQLDAPPGVWLPLPMPKDGPRFEAPPRPKDPSELVASTFKEVVGRHRVESGNVPTYFSELKSVLVIAWDVHRVVERRKGRGASLPATRTTIRLVQDRTGYLVRAEILAPVQDAEVAAEVIADLQRSADGLPKPPPDAIGDKEQLASTWAFDYVPLPPAVTMPMTFDLVVVLDPKAIPKPTNKKLTLMSIE